MKNIMKTSAAWFVTAALAGSFVVGGAVLAQTAMSTFTMSPSSLSFSMVQGGPLPTNDTVTFGVNPNQSVGWTASPSANWLSISPATSTAMTGNTVTIWVNSNAQTLAPGTYSATVLFSSTGNTATSTGTNTTTSPQFAPQSMNVTLVVTPSNGTTSSTNGPVTCSQSATMSDVGQTVTFNASGGNGIYTWSSPFITITNAVGPTFTATFNTPGTYPVVVTSNGASATCTITVTSASTGITTTPGLPNTGEQYGG